MTLEGKLNKLTALQKQLQPPKELYGIPIVDFAGEPYDGRYDSYWLSQGRIFRPLIIRKEDLPPGVINYTYTTLTRLPNESK